MMVPSCVLVLFLMQLRNPLQHVHLFYRPENVLLKSDPSKTLGFVTKLSDFGLAKILRENYYIVNRFGSPPMPRHACEEGG